MNPVLSRKGEKQLRMDSVEALRRIKDEKDKVLVDLEKALKKLLKKARVDGTMCSRKQKL